MDDQESPARRLATLERANQPADPLAPARGVVVGILIASIVWIGVAGVLWLFGVIG